MNQIRRQDLDVDRIELGEIEEALGFLLRMAQLKAFDIFFRVSGPGLKPGELTVLWAIAANPGLRQGSIARRLRIKPAHMTKLVRKMVEDGLVARQVPPDDRRSVRLSLTRAGQAVYARSRTEMRSIHRAERAAFAEHEYLELVALLRKFTGMQEPG